MRDIIEIDGKFYVDRDSHSKILDEVINGLNKATYLIKSMTEKEEKMTMYIFKLIKQIENNGNIILCQDHKGFHYEILSDEDYTKYLEETGEQPYDDEEDEE